jgi:hypothetical protein
MTDDAEIHKKRTEDDAAMLLEVGDDDAKGKVDKKKKKSKKKKEKKKRKQGELSTAEEIDAVSETKESKKGRNKEKDGAAEAEDDDDVLSKSSAGDAKQEKDDGAKTSKSASSKEKREQRRAKRECLMEKIPQTDEHGISYSKQQLRRMRKRVARGLPPLETEAEIRERQQQEAQLRREEEAELGGLSDAEDDDDKEADENDDEDVADEGGDHTEENAIDEKKDEPSEQNVPKESPSRKKARRNKPVPADYVCQACQNKNASHLHWIYDCPMKKTMPGINHKSTKNHVHEPSNLKVFVSGLPFEAKTKDVRELFAACGNMKNCKLLTFPDTGRCKGQAFLTFDSEKAAKKAIELSGIPVDNSISAEEGDTEGKNRKQTLTLKVTKQLNRSQTKKTSKFRSP